MPPAAMKQTETGIPYGPCGFESLRVSVRDKDRTNFPEAAHIFEGICGKAELSLLQL